MDSTVYLCVCAFICLQFICFVVVVFYSLCFSFGVLYCFIGFGHLFWDFVFVFRKNLKLGGHIGLGIRRNVIKHIQFKIVSHNRNIWRKFKTIDLRVKGIQSDLEKNYLKLTTSQRKIQKYLLEYIVTHLKGNILIHILEQYLPYMRDEDETQASPACTNGYTPHM